MNAELADAFLDSLLRMGRSTSCDRVLLVGADNVSTERLKPIKKKLILATHQAHVVAQLAAAGIEAVLLPGLTAGRMDRLKSALVGAVSAGYLKAGENVLCALARSDGAAIDTLMHMTAGDVEEEHTSLLVSAIDSGIPAQLLEVVVDLALRVGREGYEGRPLGTLIVVGDSTKVMERSHPLTLNPFQGYSEVERNLYDAHVRDAVRTFATLDGAFVVRDDGVVLAGGRHIHVGDCAPSLPLGLGARHMAAASISAETGAIAFAVSQSSGVVRMFQNGRIVLELEPSGRRGGDEVSDGIKAGRPVDGSYIARGGSRSAIGAPRRKKKAKSARTPKS